MRRHQEGVLADVELHARMEREDDDLAGRVPGERHPARAVGHQMMWGMPPNIRFMPPPVDSADSGAASSFHSSTWCSKNTESPWARLISATGTSSPSTWQVLLENLNSVMSRSRGASFQPESLTRLRASSGAPHVPHVACPDIILRFAPLTLDPVHGAGT